MALTICEDAWNDSQFWPNPRYGRDPVEELIKLSDEVYKEYPNSVCFASKLIFARESFFTRWLHNQTALTM